MCQLKNISLHCMYTWHCLISQRIYRFDKQCVKCKVWPVPKTTIGEASMRQICGSLKTNVCRWTCVKNNISYDEMFIIAGTMQTCFKISKQPRNVWQQYSYQSPLGELTDRHLQMISNDRIQLCQMKPTDKLMVLKKDLLASKLKRMQLLHKTIYWPPASRYITKYNLMSTSFVKTSIYFSLISVWKSNLLLKQQKNSALFFFFFFDLLWITLMK